MHTQLSTIDTIHASAHITIVATGENSSFGLPGVTTKQRITQPKITIEGRTYLSALHECNPVMNPPWSLRAWTCQEGFCSRRRLYFATEQVMYECNAGEFYEVLDAPLDPSSLWTHGHLKGGLQTFHHSLATHVRKYAKRELSHQGDVLNAMRIIFARYARFRIPVPQYWDIPTTVRAFYHDGIWLDPYPESEYTPEVPVDSSHVAFSYGLLWSLNNVSYARRRLGFPTWSWADWIAPVQWAVWKREPEVNIIPNTSYTHFDFHSRGSTQPRKGGQ
jgi:hypothetical protein